MRCRAGERRPKPVRLRQLKINQKTGMAEIAYAYNLGGKGQGIFAKQTAGLRAL